MEIKLRVFKDGKMYGHNEAVRLMYNRDILLEKEEFEVILFTGLNYNDGKEIWEDDICTLQSGGKGVVVFDGDGWYIKIGEGSFATIYMADEGIGNIHENPELLK